MVIGMGVYLPFGVCRCACAVMRVSSCVPLCVYRYACTVVRVPLCLYRYACAVVHVLLCVYRYVYRYACTVVRVPLCVYRYACTVMHVPSCVCRYACIVMRVPLWMCRYLVDVRDKCHSKMLTRGVLLRVVNQPALQTVQ